MDSDQTEEKRRNPAEHLKDHQFRPGRSGNPSGRPKGRTLMSVIKEKLCTPNDNDAELEAVADAYITAMKGGSYPHLREYIEREDGKVPDKSESQVQATITVLFQGGEAEEWAK